MVCELGAKFLKLCREVVVRGMGKFLVLVFCIALLSTNSYGKEGREEDPAEQLVEDWFQKQVK